MKQFKVKHLALTVITLIVMLTAMTGCGKAQTNTMLDKKQLTELITVGKLIVSGYHDDITEEKLASINKHCTEEGTNQIEEVINREYGVQGDGFISIQSDIDKLKETGDKLSLDKRIVEKDGELGVYRKDLTFDSYTEFIQLTDTEYREIKYSDTPVTRQEVKSDSGYNLGLCDFGYYENGLIRLKFITLQNKEQTDNINNRPILNNIQFENTTAEAQNKYTVEVNIWVENGKIVKYEQGVVNK